MARTSYRMAFTLVELLIAMAVIGVLVGMLIPAVGKVREAAAKMECANNLRQQGIALHAYHEVWEILPPQVINPGYIFNAYDENDFFKTGTYVAYNHSGFTLLLPYLDEESLYRKYDFSFAACNAVWKGPSTAPVPPLAMNGVEHPGNKEVRETCVRVFTCPSDEYPSPVDAAPNSESSESNFGSGARSNYVLNVFAAEIPFIAKGKQFPLLAPGYFFGEGLFGPNWAARFSEVIDGLSNTIAVGENTQTLGNGTNCKVYWGSASAGTVNFGVSQGLWGFVDDKYHINYGTTNTIRYRSWHAGGANFVFGDGSVRFLVNSMPFPVFHAMGSARSQELLGIE